MKVIGKLLLLSVFFYSCGSEPAQSLPKENDEDLNTESNFKENTLFQQDIAAYKTVVNVIRETGLAQNFVILPGEVEKVVAYIEKDERILEYNPEFMQLLQGDTNWHGISILAKEIGHHLSNHELKDGKATIEEEMEADRYAGFVLQKMGASLEEAIAAMRVSNEEDSTAQLALNSRIAAVTSGWNNAVKINSDTAIIASADLPKPPADEPDKNSSPFRANKPGYVYQIFLAVDTSFYYINDKNAVFGEKGGKYYLAGQKKDSNKPGFEWIFIKDEDSYGVDKKGRLWAFSTDGNFHIVGQALKL